MKNVLKVVFVIIGTIVGAGFATGQEIYLFFGKFGLKGRLLLVLSSLLFGVIIYKTLSIIDKNDIYNYQDFIKIIFKTKNQIAYNIINFIVTAFLGISFVIMCAGMGAYFYQEFQINSIIGSSIMSIVALAIFINKTKGMIKLNSIAIPFLIFVIGILIFVKTDNKGFVQNTYLIQGIYSTIIYVSYNSIVLIPVLISLRKYINRKEQRIAIALSCIIIILFLKLIIWNSIIGIPSNIKIEIPVLYIARMKSSFFALLYGIAIIFAMLTSAISAGAGFMSNISSNEKTQFVLISMLCLTAIFLSNIGFSKLLESLYPIFGVLRDITNVFYSFILKKIRFIDKLYKANKKGESHGLL